MLIGNDRLAHRACVLGTNIISPLCLICSSGMWMITSLPRRQISCITAEFRPAATGLSRPRARLCLKVRNIQTHSSATALPSKVAGGHSAPLPLPSSFPIMSQAARVTDSFRFPESQSTTGATAPTGHPCRGSCIFPFILSFTGDSVYAGALIIQAKTNRTQATKTTGILVSLDSCCFHAWLTRA